MTRFPTPLALAVAAATMLAGSVAGAQTLTTNPADVQAMMAALPDRAPVRPRRPRRVLVLTKALGYVHASIPLAARTVEEMGRKTRAWSTTVTADPADINARNLAGYDAIFLASTSGPFLDDPQDAAVTAARRQALLDFVRGGKGLAGIHAATVGYFDRRRPDPAEPGPGRVVSTWPDFTHLIGGLFKFHWNDGQVVTVKIDEPEHPLNAPFEGHVPLRVTDETYTFTDDSYSRDRVRVLTSVDYAAMSAEDKARETSPRADGDYPLSWIRREGGGRVFYEAHGHNEKVYAIAPLLAHLLYGMQYVLGDLPADDAPRRAGGRPRD